jgi:hypothetical protein
MIGLRWTYPGKQTVSIFNSSIISGIVRLQLGIFNDGEAGFKKQNVCTTTVGYRLISARLPLCFKLFLELDKAADF